mgnify:CR=1 FL=1
MFFRLLGTCCHIFGPVWVICLDACMVLLCLICGFWSCLVSCACTLVFNLYCIFIGFGRSFFDTLYINLATFNLCNCFSFNRLSWLNSGSVCSLYFLLVMLLIIFFVEQLLDLHMYHGCHPTELFHIPCGAVQVFHIRF